ncbi:hypothetical protein VTO73DRAFT_5499 [Trametes versicolor]
MRVCVRRASCGRASPPGLRGCDTGVVYGCRCGPVRMASAWVRSGSGRPRVMSISEDLLLFARHDLRRPVL